jgi:hypothetical protein
VDTCDYSGERSTYYNKVVICSVYIVKAKSAHPLYQQGYALANNDRQQIIKLEPLVVEGVPSETGYLKQLQLNSCISL